MTLQDLLHQKTEDQVTYSDILQTDEWKVRRNEILKRDDFYCTKCGLSETLWHAGKLISFDKSKYLDIVYQGERITADAPFESDRNIYLHVHHKHYVLGRLPWEYSDEELTTLCNWCHWELHENEQIKVYQESDSGLEDLNMKICSRCNGAGVFPEYSHVQAGICFKCNGARFEELIGTPKSNWFK